MGHLMVREIPDFPGYFVSKCGKMFSNRRPRKMHPLKCWINTGGYVAVNVYDVTGKRHTSLVHRLVLLTYVGRPEGEKYHGCHKDGNTQNNQLENLYWGTHQENMFMEILREVNEVDWPN